VVTSPDRFTGSVRVPSLRGVGDRRRLFADGRVRDVRELLDPERTATGHPFGLDLDPADRADLVAYLETL
jgi:cytochrome c peroxidase